MLQSAKKYTLLCKTKCSRYCLLGRSGAKFIFLHMGHAEMFLLDVTRQHMHIPGLPCVEVPRGSEWPVDVHCCLLFFVHLLCSTFLTMSCFMLNCHPEFFLSSTCSGLEELRPRITTDQSLDHCQQTALA